MKFIVDECIGPSVANWLSTLYDTVSIYNELRGSSDEEVLKKAFLENRILITSDKDFGDMIFRKKMDHCGVILLRLTDQSTTNKIKFLKKFFEQYINEIDSNFIVITDLSVRVTKSTFVEN